MAKKQLGTRVDERAIETIDKWATENGYSRAAAIERAIYELAEGEEALPNDDSGNAELVEVLRAEVTSLSAAVSSLWAELAAKNNQISEIDNRLATALELADQAQKLQLAQALLTQPKESRTLPERIAAFFAGDRKD